MLVVPVLVYTFNLYPVAPVTAFQLAVKPVAETLVAAVAVGAARMPLP